jgi:hypothetical protein
MADFGLGLSFCVDASVVAKKLAREVLSSSLLCHATISAPERISCKARQHPSSQKAPFAENLSESVQNVTRILLRECNGKSEAPNGKKTERRRVDELYPFATPNVLDPVVGNAQLHASWSGPQNASICGIGRLTDRRFDLSGLR